MSQSYGIDEEEAQRDAEREAQDVFHELARALVRARIKHPLTDMAPDGTGLSGGRETYKKIAQQACDRADREGRLTFADVLEEEAAEALDARTPAELRAELMDVMCCSLRRVLAIDRRAAGLKVLPSVASSPPHLSVALGSLRARREALGWKGGHGSGRSSSDDKADALMDAAIILIQRAAALLGED